MFAVHLPQNLTKITVDPTDKSNKKNNRRSIKVIERFIQPTEGQLNAIADLLSALLKKPCSVATGSDAKNAADSNQEVNS